MCTQSNENPGLKEDNLYIYIALTLMTVVT